jgi:lipoate-protein ligase A
MVVAGKKISGNAQARKKGVILQHGTLLLDCDLRVMAKVLRIPFNLIDSKVTTLKKELDGKTVQEAETMADVKMIEDTLRIGFEKSLGVRLANGELSEFELRQSEKLRKKYSSEDWTKMR